ncbi:MAG: hypothetical protein AB7D06_08095 [Pedobacter sp.]|jgi:hypothetical protein
MGKGQKPEHLEKRWEAQRQETRKEIRELVAAVRELGLPETPASLEEVGLSTQSLLYKGHVKEELKELKWGKQKHLKIPAPGETITREEYVKIQEDRDRYKKKWHKAIADKNEEVRKRQNAEKKVDELKEELKTVRGHLAILQLLGK